MNIKDALQTVADDNNITTMHELTDACKASPSFFSVIVGEVKATLEDEGKRASTQNVALALNVLLENNKG